MLAMFAVYVALGMDVNISGDKTRPRGVPVGVLSDMAKSARIGISESRRAWVMPWITDLLNDNDTKANFDSGLGGLSFVCGTIIFDRPCLLPPLLVRGGGQSKNRP